MTIITLEHGIWGNANPEEPIFGLRINSNLGDLNPMCYYNFPLTLQYLRLTKYKNL